MPKSPVPDRSLLVDRIAQDIQSGVFGAGAWLKQIDVQERYQANRLEVRRALDQLALKRVIVHVPNRGYHVHLPDPRRMGEIRDVRVLLECGAAVEVIANATSQHVDRLQEEADRFASLLNDGTLMQQYETNLAFHAAMYDMCSNKELIGLIQELRARTPAGVVTEWMTRARIEQSAEEHFAMVAAIRAGDLADLQRILRAHIVQTLS
jgi:DNA-binding GntR family transcriptional regulator